MVSFTCDNICSGPLWFCATGSTGDDGQEAIVNEWSKHVGDDVDKDIISICHVWIIDVVFEFYFQMFSKQHKNLIF